MKKEFEDVRRHKVEVKPKWKECFDTYKVVREKLLPDGTGIVVDFLNAEGRGRTVDIVGEDFKEYLAWKNPTPKKEALEPAETKAEKPETKPEKKPVKAGK